MEYIDSFDEVTTISQEQLPISREECPCYKCSEEQIFVHDSGWKETVNNMEYHTYGEPCGECGEDRTQYLDLGRKGRYVCPECR